MNKKIIILMVLVVILGTGWFVFRVMSRSIETSPTEKEDKPFQCPQYAPTAPGWCGDGKIIQRGDDERGCPQPPRCERSSKETQEKPPIVEHFACSDYCPGPQEQYMVKIYQGIENEEECRRIGGNPYVYYGWGEFHICLAD